MLNTQQPILDRRLGSPTPAMTEHAASPGCLPGEASFDLAMSQALSDGMNPSRINAEPATGGTGKKAPLTTRRTAARHPSTEPGCEREAAPKANAESAQQSSTAAASEGQTSDNTSKPAFKAELAEAQVIETRDGSTAAASTWNPFAVLTVSATAHLVGSDLSHAAGHNVDATVVAPGNSPISPALLAGTARPVGLQPVGGEADHQSLPPPSGSENQPQPLRENPLRMGAWELATEATQQTATTPAPVMSDRSADSLESEITTLPPQPSKAQSSTFDSSAALDSATARPSPVSRGTGGAKSSSWIEKPEEMSRAQQSTEQTLPGKAASPTRSADNAGFTFDRHAESPTRGDGNPSSLVSLAPGIPSAVTSPIRISDGIPVAQVESNGWRPASGPEGLQQRITHCVVELKRLQVDSMSVVVKPDAQTEISLLLSAQGGSVDVAALVKRGDFNNLNLHWGQLQQTLSSQGIRLGVLQESASSAFAGNGSTDGFASPGREHEPKQELDEASAREPDSAAAPTSPRKRASSPGVGARLSFESWA